MTKHSNEKKLLADLLGGDDNLREATLRRGLAAARGKRIQRRVIRVGAVLGGVIFVLSLLHTNNRDSNRPVAGYKDRNPDFQSLPQPVAANVIAGTTIRVLSDKELLDLFSNRPVALVGRPGKQKLIIFEGVNN
jgi:hypothetical protein